MIKNRKMGHIGLATNDVEKDAQWYIDVLGFEVAGKFRGDDGTNVYFLKNDDVVLVKGSHSMNLKEIVEKI